LFFKLWYPFRFGTLSDYFKEVNARGSQFDTLSGDFFVYSDIFTDGVPAYWSGYFTTRPYMKQLSRLNPGANLTIASYNASVVRIYK
jgi:hypothetical protein